MGVAQILKKNWTRPQRRCANTESDLEPIAGDWQKITQPKLRIFRIDSSNCVFRLWTLRTVERHDVYSSRTITSCEVNRSEPRYCVSWVGDKWVGVGLPLPPKIPKRTRKLKSWPWVKEAAQKCSSRCTTYTLMESQGDPLGSGRANQSKFEESESS